MSATGDHVLDKDWQDFLSALETHGVEYMLAGDLQVAVIGLDDLRANKQAVGRLQDLADLEQLQGADETGSGEHHA